MKNDIMILCDRMKKCKDRKGCCVNEMVCARTVLKQFINNDYDKLLKLKVELEYFKQTPCEIWSSLSFFFTFASLILAYIAVLLSVLNETQKNEMGINVIVICLVILLICVIVMNLVFCYNYKFDCKRKYVFFLSQAIEEIHIKND